MPIALNTVAVNATVDDAGRITRWFDKESGTDILSSPWHESEVTMGGSSLVDWTLIESRPNRPRYQAESGATKVIKVGFRNIDVEYDADLAVQVPLTAARSEVTANCAVVRDGAVIVSIEWAGAVQTAPDSEQDARPIVLVGAGAFLVAVSVADRSEMLTAT